MKALIKGRFGIECVDREAPRIRAPDDVLIRVSCAAICRTDVFAANGELPVAEGRILGHEFTGVVEAVGEGVSRVALNESVVVDPLLACGRCRDCISGANHLCAVAGFLGLDSDGAFAEFVLVDESRVHHLPMHVNDSVGAYAEPLSATMAVLEASLPYEGRIAVTGKGRIAELTHLVLEDHGYDVSSAPWSEGDFDVVVETDLCSANAEATIQLLKPGGLLVLKSRVPAPVELPRLTCVKRRIRIESVHYAPFPRAMEYLERRSQRLQSLVGSEWPLEQHEQAFAEACADEALKVYFKPNG